MKIIARCANTLCDVEDPNKINFRSILSEIDIEDILWEKERRKVDKIVVKTNKDVPVNSYKGRCLTSTDRSLRTFYTAHKLDVLLSAADSELDYQIDNRELMDLEKRLETLLNFKTKEEISLKAAICSLNRVESKIKKVKEKIKELEIAKK